MTRPRALGVEDNPLHAQSVVEVLERIGFEVFTVPTSAEAYERLTPPHSFDLVVLDLHLGLDPTGVTGLDILGWIRGRGDAVPVIFLTGDVEIEFGIEAMRRGATDYLVKRPGYTDELARAVRQITGPTAEPRSLRVRSAAPRHPICGNSIAMEHVRRLARQYGASGENVLITGESGVGKELVAREVHAASDRAGQPFIAVSMIELSETLVESQIFGHVAGSFTGAVKDHPGFVGAANGGTLFLDEIGAMPLALQGKLLRLIEQREYWPVGGSACRRADVRFIAATNRNLRQAIEDKTFLLDLYFRLNVLPIQVPALRERVEDIPVLVEWFLQRDAPAEQIRLSAAEITRLMVARWRGNVRELENVVKRALVMFRQTGILSFELEEQEDDDSPIPREQLIAALTRCGGSIKDTAEDLRTYSRKIQRYMKKYGLTRDAFVRGSR